MEDVAEARGGVTHPVRDVEPAVGRLDGRSSRAVLGLLDGVVHARIEEVLLLDAGVLHRSREAPRDPAAGACVDEAVLRARVQQVAPLDEAGVEDHVALLRRPGLPSPVS